MQYTELLPGAAHLPGPRDRPRRAPERRPDAGELHLDRSRARRRTRAAGDDGSCPARRDHDREPDRDLHASPPSPGPSSSARSTASRSRRASSPAEYDDLLPGRPRVPRAAAAPTCVPATSTRRRRTYEWTVMAPPETTIDPAPAADRATARPRPSSSPPTSRTRTFFCSLDGLGFTACTSPKTYGGLIDGAHTFEVVAAARSWACVDETPALHEWTVAVPPETTILFGPDPTTTDTSAAFTFSAHRHRPDLRVLARRRPRSPSARRQSVPGRRPRDPADRRPAHLRGRAPPTPRATSTRRPPATPGPSSTTRAPRDDDHRRRARLGDLQLRRIRQRHAAASSPTSAASTARPSRPARARSATRSNDGRPHLRGARGRPRRQRRPDARALLWTWSPRRHARRRPQSTPVPRPARQPPPPTSASAPTRPARASSARSTARPSPLVHRPWNTKVWGWAITSSGCGRSTRPGTGTSPRRAIAGQWSTPAPRRPPSTPARRPAPRMPPPL